ncbi:MAG TPA: S8 family serine peptidase [Blastocatellia bacterium]|nr:S8 family serine peptidase [Blastocatellia bacterium]
MKKFLILTTAFALLLVALTPLTRATEAARTLRKPNGAAQPAGAGSFFVPGEIIVKLKAQVAPSRSTQPVESMEKVAELVRISSGQEQPVPVEPLIRKRLSGRIAAIATQRGIDRTYVMKLDPASDIQAAIASLKASGNVEYAEPNYLVKPGGQMLPSAVSPPNDPQFANQWALSNPGYYVDNDRATQGADIKAQEAWKITSGSPDVIIAVVDSGVDINHPDLAANIYTNPGEIAGNGIDDDHNGYVDDVHGFNVADQNGDVSDVLGHGTMMAGLIAAVMNNGIGITGIAQCKILPVKFFKNVGLAPGNVQGSVADAARGIIYAIAAGASIINASWSTMLDPGTVSATDVQALKDAVRASDDADVLLVCIAGNDGLDNDVSAIYPAHYQLPNQIVVAASDYNDQIWHVLGLPQDIESGFGQQTVQLAAPGVSVVTTLASGDCAFCSSSTDPAGAYGEIAGTSASAAYVSGVAGLVKSVFPEANAPVIRRRILEGVDAIPGLEPWVSTGGRLNAVNPLTLQLSITPPALSRLKYKPKPQMLTIFGAALQRGAHVIVGSTVYTTRPRVAGTSSPLVATVPPSAFPAGVPVTVSLRNPDGGLSQALTITR